MSKSTEWNKHFEETWDAAMLELGRQSPTYATLVGQVGKKSADAMVANGAKGIFGERKQVQRAVSSNLRDFVAGKSIIDLMAGEGTATIPLALAKITKKLHLVDNGHSAMTQGVGWKLARREPSITTHAIDLSSGGSEALPKADLAVLIDTGLALPEINRMKGVPEGVPPATSYLYRGNHVIGATITFEEILAKLRQSGIGVLRVYETPFFTDPLSAEEWRAHLESSLNLGETWRFEEVSTVGPYDTLVTEFKA